MARSQPLRRKQPMNISFPDEKHIAPMFFGEDDSDEKEN